MWSIFRPAFRSAVSFAQAHLRLLKEQQHCFSLYHITLLAHVQCSCASSDDVLALSIISLVLHEANSEHTAFLPPEKV